MVEEKSEEDLRLGTRTGIRGVSEDKRDDFQINSCFFIKMNVIYMLHRMDTAILNFRNETHSEHDANKTPTHRRLPRKHARCGIVNI